MSRTFPHWSCVLFLCERCRLFDSDWSIYPILGIMGILLRHRIWCRKLLLVPFGIPLTAVLFLAHVLKVLSPAPQEHYGRG